MAKKRKYNLKATMLTLLVLIVAAGGCGLVLWQIGPSLASKLMEKVHPESSLTGAENSDVPASSAAVSVSANSAPAKPADPPVPVGIFSENWRRASTRVTTMTVEQKVGQVFIFRCMPTGAVKTVDDFQPGGYCMMADFFKDKSPEMVRETIAKYQRSSKIPMIICCDEEGGTVVRISRYPALAPKKYNSPQQVFANGGMEAIKSDTLSKAAMMKDLGLNLNLAPVCDISTNPNDFINARSFGRNADATAQFITTSVNAYKEIGISCTLKHFPGYGGTADTHTGIAYDERPYSDFVKSDFLPFKAGIGAGAQCVLVSHNIAKSIDPDKPSSISPKVLAVLRKELGFTGIIMTDDLSMDGIMDYTDGKSPCVEAFLAGEDVLLSTNYKDDYAAVLAAVKDGTIPQERLDESVTRVLAWKYTSGLMQ